MRSATDTPAAAGRCSDCRPIAIQLELRAKETVLPWPNSARDRRPDKLIRHTSKPRTPSSSATAALYRVLTVRDAEFLVEVADMRLNGGRGHRRRRQSVRCCNRNR